MKNAEEMTPSELRELADKIEQENSKQLAQEVIPNVTGTFKEDVYFIWESNIEDSMYKIMGSFRDHLAEHDSHGLNEEQFKVFLNDIGLSIKESACILRKGEVVEGFIDGDETLWYAYGESGTIEDLTNVEQFLDIKE